MKKLLWLTALLGLFFVFPHTALAGSVYNFAGTYPATITVTSATSANVAITVPGSSTNKKVLACIIEKSKITSANCGSDAPIVNTIFNKEIQSQKKDTVLSFKLSNLSTSKTYDLFITDDADPTKYLLHEFTTASTASNYTDTPTTMTAKDGDDIIVSTTIDPSKYSNYQDFSASLIYSRSNDLSSPINGGAISGKQSSDPNSAVGANATNTPGTFFWRLKNLSPSTIYYYQITVTPPGGTGIKSTINNFNSSSGVTIAPGSDAAQADLNQRSYTLLLDPTKKTILPDPDLCAQERAAGQHPQFCDMNDVLNYALKLMIGLSAVFLVFRLMFEGYKYMVSDVPFLKASAKSGFFTALTGLLLAMSSYLILNTINPKLVSNTINVSQLSISVDGDANTPTTFVPNGQMPTGVICPSSGRSASVAGVAQSFVGKVTYKYGGKSAAAQSDGKAALDCSAWTNTVLKCSGFTTPGDYKNSGSADIFSGAEQVDMSKNFTTSGSDVLINGKKLNPGDLVGWPQTSTYGHVILYVGNKTFMDSHSGGGSGGAIGTYSAAQIQKLFGGSSPSKTITAVKRIPL